MAPTPVSNSDAEATPEVASKFKEILKSNGITDSVSQVIIKDSGLKGENFGSVTDYITVNFKGTRKEPLHLFIKKKPDSPQYAAMLDAMGTFLKETSFLTEYLPEAREYCKSVGQGNLMDFYTKCYFGDDNIIVLENLVLGRDFILLKKEERQDFDSAKLAITNLAKHHAISYAILEKLGGPTAFYKRYPNLEFESFTTGTIREMLNPSFENTIRTYIKMLERCGLEGSSEAIEKLKSFQGKAFDLAIGSIASTAEDLIVLNHGDYWNNNMMFLKNEKTDKLVDHVPVDFQIVRLTSPCVDLTYFFFTSVKPEVRRWRLRELLQVYLDTLKFVGNDLGHVIDISLEKLEAEYCRHFQLGYFFGMMFSSGGAMEATKGLDVREAKDFMSLMEKMDELVTKWVEDNPDKCKEEAVDII